jgi:hypothetical protein
MRQNCSLHFALADFKSGLKACLLNVSNLEFMYVPGNTHPLDAVIYFEPDSKNSQ